MKKFVIAAMLIAGAASFSTIAEAGDTYVNGYYRSNGTYVQPHYRSSPNSTTSDNWSTRGNVNPYTGQSGTRNPNSYNSYGDSYGSGYNSGNSGYNNNYNSNRWR